MQTTPAQPDLSSSQSKPYKLEDWQGGNRSLKEEFDYPIEDVEGEIPPELNGTLFRNGPGLLDIFGQRIHHPFDGDGMVCALAKRDEVVRILQRTRPFPQPLCADRSLL